MAHMLDQGSIIVGVIMIYLQHECVIFTRCHDLDKL